MATEIDEVHDCQEGDNHNDDKEEDEKESGEIITMVLGDCKPAIGGTPSRPLKMKFRQFSSECHQTVENKLVEDHGIDPPRASASLSDEDHFNLWLEGLVS